MRLFIVNIAIPQPLETAYRIIKFKAPNIRCALAWIDLKLRGPEYVSEVSVYLFGRLHVVWDYVNGSRKIKLKLYKKGGRRR